MLRAMSRETSHGIDHGESPAAELERARLAVERADLRAQKAEHRADMAESELAREREADLRLQKYSHFQLWLRVLDAARWAPMVVAFWVPLQALQPIARSFAGTDTRFDGSLRISIWFSIAVTVGWGVTATQSRLRKRKIKTQRERLTQLEKELDAARESVRSKDKPQKPQKPRQRQPK